MACLIQARPTRKFPQGVLRKLPRDARKCYGGWQIAEDHHRITWPDVLEPHSKALVYGGADAILDKNAILSAITNPYIGYRESIWEQAASLLRSLVCNHGFVDRNKRTALILTERLIANSGYRFCEDADAEIEETILQVACGEMDFTAVLRRFSNQIETSPIE